MTLVALHLFHRSIDSYRLAERVVRDGGAPLGWRASRVAGCFGVQQERAEFKSPVVAPARSGGRGTPLNVNAGAAPSEGPPARDRGVDPHA